MDRNSILAFPRPPGKHTSASFLRKNTPVFKAKLKHVRALDSCWL